MFWISAAAEWRAARPAFPIVMTVALSESVRSLLDGRNFATITTLAADGSPQSSVMWVGRHDGTIVFSTIATRVKARNIARDPRVTVSIFDLANPYHSAEIRGTAELVEDPNRSLPLELSRKYLGEDPPGDPEGARRVIIRVTPERLVEFSV